MVLESTIICVDNSEWMRNGDFLPSRIQAQQDGVGIICHAKTRQNPENNVGLLTLASLEVLVTLTSDSGKILNKLHHVQPKGKVKLLTGIRIAHLALKHRLGKNHKMRIVAFVGSPVEANEKELTKLAKKLKKEKVNVDIVCLAEDNETSERLSNFINTLNGKDGTGSHLVTIPPGPSLAEAIRTSPIIQGEDGYTPAGGFGSGFDDIDPNLDPELALALRVSMEEQRMRQESEAREATDASKEESVKSEQQQQPPSSAPAAGNTNDDALLQNALAMSLGEGRLDVGGLSEDEQIAMAIQMSMQESQDDSRPTTGASEDVTSSEAPSAMDTDEPGKEGSDEQDYSAVMNDPEFLQHLVSSLPDVDPNSEAVRSALRALTQQNDEEEKKEGDKNDSEK